ncbi:hypothetical protein AVEN_18193-1 [Araneus ventricosus]|uniref:Reverse transcriptase domain-containing protein n=1 Tax=Araneus ventricosus TaxID=182803 RepID=A0A4Y2AII5_ARAVE|nr:hypothetical protein AVEN_18193-1 [Araneus ventricosus]
MIRSFLSNRVIADEENDIEFKYNVAVLQGSRLGPILWLLESDGLLSLANLDGNAKVIMFADDIAILIAEPEAFRFTRSRRNVLQHVENWAGKYGLRINPSK